VLYCSFEPCRAGYNDHRRSGARWRAESFSGKDNLPAEGGGVARSGREGGAFETATYAD